MLCCCRACTRFACTRAAPPRKYRYLRGPWRTPALYFSVSPLMKRYAEVIAEPGVSSRRGYERGDASIIAILGCASGLFAALPLALYAGSAEVRALYCSPHLLWP